MDILTQKYPPYTSNTPKVPDKLNDVLSSAKTWMGDELKKLEQRLEQHNKRMGSQDPADLQYKIDTALSFGPGTIGKVADKARTMLGNVMQDIGYGYKEVPIMRGTENAGKVRYQIHPEDSKTLILDHIEGNKSHKGAASDALQQLVQKYNANTIMPSTGGFTPDGYKMMEKFKANNPDIKVIDMFDKGYKEIPMFPWWEK
jgi:hypothetical protein